MPATPTGQFDHQADRSRHDRDHSRDALHELEDALSSPATGRESRWQHRVTAAIDHLLEALDTQAATDHDTASLLSDIARDHPRLSRRVDDLRRDHRRIVDELTNIHGELTAEPDRERIEELRDRIADIARGYRRHRSQEADLVYEAVNVDLGVGD